MSPCSLPTSGVSHCGNGLIETTARSREGICGQKGQVLSPSEAQESEPAPLRQQWSHEEIGANRDHRSDAAGEI